MKFIYSAIAFFCLLGLSASAQQDTTILKTIITKTKKLADEQPQEKVYVHFDKPYYSVADTIWFKTYVTFEQNLPSPFSKIVYIDIINGQDSLIQSLKIPLTNSVASGNIPLNPGLYKQDNYRIKAYTLWMLNFGEEAFFHKTIPIGQTINKELLTHFTYNSVGGKSESIKARIQFKNADKVPYANKPVTWKVDANYETVDKGKAVTDQNGFINITINPKKNEMIELGELITDIAATPTDIINSTFKIKQSKGDNDVQFFAEGGDFIVGIPTRMSYKAVTAKGLGIDLSGTVTDNENNEVTKFTSSHLGMGSFFLTADASKTYKANITFKDGKVKSYELPKPVTSGISAQITSVTDQQINLKILANDAYFQANQGKGFYITGMNNGLVFYAAQAKLSSQMTIAKMDKAQFPAGVLQITLFSAAGEPMSERLVFVTHKDSVKLSVKTDLPAYKPRQKVKMTVSAKNGAVGLTGDYSVSVIDEKKVPVDEDSETTILSYLLLSSDLKGFIEKPSYYFNKINDKKVAELDLVMLTHGYRRFSFKDLLANKIAPITQYPEQDMRITGTLRDRTGMPVKKGILRLTVPGTRIASEITSSPTGVFVFPNLNFPDSSKVVINGKYSMNPPNMMMMLDGAALPAVGRNPYPATEMLNIDSTLSSYMDNSKKQFNYLNQLKEVVIKGAPVKRPSHADHSALSGLGMMPEHLIEGSRFAGCNIVLQCLKTMATGLTYDEQEYKFYITRDYNAGGRTPVQVFLNGMPVDANHLNTMNAAEIESVEIFLRDELGTVNRAYQSNGVLVVNTKKIEKGKAMSLADLKKLLPEANILTFYPKGFAKEREFYAPKYPNAANTYTNNDWRSTIYWNPKVITDAAGNFSFEFYNATTAGTYKAVVEGIDKNGHVGRAVYRFTVK